MVKSHGLLVRRVPLLLDGARYRKVSRAAEQRGVSVAAVIRSAIDDMPADHERRRRAIESILAAEPMPVPDDSRDLRRELDEAHERAR